MNDNIAAIIVVCTILGLGLAVFPWFWFWRLIFKISDRRKAKKSKKEVSLARSTMVGYISEIQKNTMNIFLKTKKETYSYCDYCGGRIVSGNKYHHTCLMKKYEGIVIKQ